MFLELMRSKKKSTCDSKEDFPNNEIWIQFCTLVYLLFPISTEL